MNAIFNTNKRLESDENTFNNVQLAEIADQIDSLIDADFSLNERLWGWSYIDNVSTLQIRRPEICSLNDQAIIIQGGIEKIEVLLFAVARYSLLYPDSIIIISTWEDSSWLSIHKIMNLIRNKDNIHLILSPKPSFKGYGGMNTILQIISTINGIKIAKQLGAKYALKVRTDIVLGSLDFLQAFSLNHKLFSKGTPTSQKGKIIVLSMNSYLCRPFSISDHVSYGHIDDMELMWDLELPTSNQSRRNVNFQNKTLMHEPMSNSDLIHLAWSAKEAMMDEAYLVSNLMNAAGFCYTADWFDSKNFLTSCFVVMDTSTFDIFWPKYGGALSYSKFHHKPISNFASSSSGMAEITFTTWLNWYLAIHVQHGQI